MRILRKLFNRQVGMILLVMLLIVTVAILVNVIGIRVTGGIAAWEHWLKDQAPRFFLWRMFLYAGTAYG